MTQATENIDSLDESLDTSSVEGVFDEREPFSADPENSPFVSPVRESQLQRAAHQLRYGELLLVLAGVGGAGKSFFFAKLTQDLRDMPQVIAFDAQALNAPEAFLGFILESLKPQMALEPGVPVGALLATIRAALAQNIEPPVLMIDNADALSDKALAMLLSLIASAGGSVTMKTVLAGSSRLVERLDHLNTLEVLIYDIELANLTEGQWQEYVTVELAEFGLPVPKSLSDERIADIALSEAGHVGNTLSVFTGELRAAQAVESEPASASFRLGLPPTHLFTILALVACLALVVLAGERLWSGMGQGESIVDLARPLPSSAEPAESDQSISETPLFDKSTEPVSVGSNEPNNELSLGESESEIPESSVVELKGSIGEGTAESAQELDAEVQSSKDQAAAAEVAPVVEIMERDEESLPVSVAPGTPIASNNSAQTIESPSKAISEGLLASIPDDHYLLQIMAAQNRASLEAFVAAQSNARSLKIVNTPRATGDWFVLLQGDYASVSAAKAGIKSLPQAQQKDGVWPRKAADIKQLMGAN